MRCTAWKGVRIATLDPVLRGVEHDVVAVRDGRIAARREPARDPDFASAPREDLARGLTATSIIGARL